MRKQDLDFGEDGLAVRVVDPSHVAMIKMDVDSAAFDTWEADETKLGLEMRKLKDIVGLAAAGDMVELAYNDESGQATINIGRIDLNLRPLDNTTLNPPNVPSLELPWLQYLGQNSSHKHSEQQDKWVDRLICH